MKRFLLSSLMLLMIVFWANSQNVTIQIGGLVTELSTGIPIENQEIYIMSDSSNPAGGGYFNIVYTDVNGEFNDYPSVPAGTPILFFIGTSDCAGVWHQETGLSTNAPIYVTFSICRVLLPTSCAASFYAYPDSANPAGGSLGWQFIDASLGNPNQWVWDFGDGTGSTLQNPFHTYTQAGTYNVTLTISTPDSCQSTFTLPVYAGINIPICQAYFSYVQNGVSNDFDFYDLSSGNTIAWAWDFGDGTTSTLQSPSHTFAQQGTYLVCLSIFTSDSCYNNYCESITIGGGTGCQAMFYAIPDSLNPGLTFSFIDISMGNPTSWLWEFGDGTTSALQYPVHTYNSAGFYNVCLTISDVPTGCQSTFCDTLRVDMPWPCSNYFITNAIGLTVEFTGVATGGTAPYTYLWDFGDGTTSTLSDPVHTYSILGVYTVIFTTTDATGCTYTSATDVYLGNPIDRYIIGQVSADNSFLDSGLAYLYELDSATNLLFVVDSVQIDSIGMYLFEVLDYGIFYVKAEPSPNSLYYTSHIPTYYGNTIFWGSALPIDATQIVNPYNIDLVPVLGPIQGNGLISGQVTNGGQKILSNGTPAPDVEVLLINSNDEPVGMIYSDNQGFFAFESLGMGTYKVYAEVTGLNTNPAQVTLSGTNPTWNNISVVITPTGVINGIHESKTETLQARNLYPNPASSAAYLEFNLNGSSSVEVNVSNLVGEKVLTTQYDLSSGNHRITIPVEGLPSGQYFVSLKTRNGNDLVRKLTIVR
ncbi:MAG: PKD domain-containing protein [Bacteroidetes bacterium]|nr:PKD domain-containing protein [Bacteroidota bacterium]